MLVKKKMLGTAAYIQKVLMSFLLNSEENCQFVITYIENRGAEKVLSGC